MKNGIYDRREFQIVLYEKEGTAPFVIVNNDGCENRPIVLYGENAERLILAIADCLVTDGEEKGS